MTATPARRRLRAAALTAALLAVPAAQASDHRDGPAAKANPAADLTDLYTWMDGTNVVFGLGVSPQAAADAKFATNVQYVVHTESSGTFNTAGVKLDVICTFDAAQKISCWVGDKDYVTGDASATAGLASKSGKVKVFAGRRADPAFFNLDGFNAVRAAVAQALPAMTPDAAGCVAVDASTAGMIAQQLKSDPNSVPPGGPPKNFFSGTNVLAIVLSIDKSLLTGGGTLVSAWASTNEGK